MSINKWLSKEIGQLRTKLGPWGMVLAVTVTIILGIVTFVIVHFQKSIRQRLDELDTRLSRGLVYRHDNDDDDTNNTNSSGKGSAKGRKRVRALELQEDLLQNYGDTVTSLGRYLSSLRVSDETIPQLLERELEATIGSALLQHFGPRLGAALLPMLGISHVDSWIDKVAGAIASFVASYLLMDGATERDDVAAFPFSVSEIVAFANLNQKMRSTTEASPGTTTAVEWMSRGEIGYSPTYASSPATKDSDDNPLPNNDDDNDLIPNPFILEQHYEAAIAGLEGRIRQQACVTATNPSPNVAESLTTTSAYEPHDRSLPKPVPINERLLPGLHMGWGQAKCTHTKREILQNRLLAVLMTKLSYNYYLIEQHHRHGTKIELFGVQYAGKLCHFPEDLVQVLMDQGHMIEVCPRSTITTFGIAACVLEKDNRWKNIPLALFFRTGYEKRNGQPSYFSAPHGGMDLSVKGGPFLPKCDIQFYVAIEGLCGWHSNHNVDLPWLQAVSTTDVYDRTQALQAVRMAGLLAVTFNSLATQMNLPFGGYGILGVCNDSAAFIDFAVRGETNMYPLISTGRFLFHTGHRLLDLKDALSQYPNASADIRRLLTAACNLDSDIHNSPSQLIGATRRYLANNPVSYFQLTEDSKAMMKAIAQIYQDYVNSDQGERQQGRDPSLSNFVSLLFHDRGV